MINDRFREVPNPHPLPSCWAGCSGEIGQERGGGQLVSQGHSELWDQTEHWSYLCSSPGRVLSHRVRKMSARAEKAWPWSPLNPFC